MAIHSPQISHGQAVATVAHPAIVVTGHRKRNVDTTYRRMAYATWMIVLGLLVVFARLIWLGLQEEPSRFEGQVLSATLAARPAILDRNGIPMAMDIRVPSLFAEPRRILDVEEAARAIRDVLPHLDFDWLRNRLDGKGGFAWIARELTPQTETEIMRRGIPGLEFLTETKRFYPAFNQAAHILGAVNVDNAGVAGIETYIDDLYDLRILHATGLGKGTTMEPLFLSIDMRVQNVLHAELVGALERYSAIAAAGALIDVHSGELIALASLPDFDPNTPASMLVEGRFNRMTAGIFEPASIFKPITIAGALDTGAITLDDQVDAGTPVRFGRHTISDYYGKNRVLSVPEVLTYSSNIGTIRIAQAMGSDAFRAYLSTMGFDASPSLEVPEARAPVLPKTLSDVAAATISFGHGLSVTPLQMLVATAALVNDGFLVQPTLVRAETAAAAAVGKPVLKAQTSLQMRYLLRLNALQGSARRANALASGYRLGGKTGTAEKVVRGRYSSEVVTTFFSSVFPLDVPRYAMLVMIDEPKAEGPGLGRTAAYNAGDVTGRITARIAPMLGILPNDWDNFPPAQLQAASNPPHPHET